MGGEGREGDWECSGCKNRNYAFRSFCNRCKQPRLLVDTKTPPDSKWLPRIGDWICTGCTNNNYASREKCKKCGQPKEVAAMPAVAIPGALPPYSHHVARGQGVPELRIPPTSNWPLGGHHSNGNPLAYPTNQLPSVPKGWRNGDWICSCGFHNYSSRARARSFNSCVNKLCKKCNASQPPAIGMKRLASEDLVQEWDNKRLNAGHMEHNFLASGLQRSYQGFDPVIGNGGDPRAGIFAPYPNANQTVTPNPNMPGPLLQVPVQLPNPTPALLGKGAKQWRSGDWMCTNCSNHNYASRVQCNRCKTPREAGSQPVNAV